ncbi:MAG: hypothetical protein HY721_10500 [Planctomycetes bacterium]|nr:hypothetical protein [Planctomycetota bacterium]
MRPALVSLSLLELAPALALALALSCGPATAAPEAEVEPVVEAQRLVERVAVFWGQAASTAHNLDPFVEGRLAELAQVEEVRAWLRQRIRSTDGGRASEYFRELLFAVLLLGGVTAEDADLALELSDAGAGPDRLDLAFLATQLLLRAPLEMTGDLSAKLLGRLADRAAAALENDLAVPLWLLAERLPAGQVRDALAGAWKRASPANTRARDDPDAAFVELSLLGAGGKPAPDAMWARRPSDGAFLLVWPDGKIRLRLDSRSTAGGQLDLKLVIQGYHDEPSLKLKVGRGLRKETVVLGARRSAVHGKLRAPPKVQLLARVTRGVPFGHSPRGGYWAPGPYVGAVSAGGTFRVPYTRRDDPDSLVFFDADGRVAAATPVAVPAEGGDVDLGEIEPRPVRGLVHVPIELAWPAGQPGPEHLYAWIEWRPKAPGAGAARAAGSAGATGSAGAPGTTHVPVQGLFHLLDGGPGRAGVALNMPPGEYEYAVKFDRDVPPLEGVFRVRDAAHALVLKPGPPSGPTVAAPTPQAPVREHPLAGVGRWFSVAAARAGEAALAWSEAHDVKLRLVAGSELRPPRTVYGRRQAQDPLAGPVELQAGPGGDLLLAALFGSDGKDWSARLLRLSPEGEPRGPWLDLAERGPGEAHGLPALLFPEEETLLTVTPTSGPAGQKLLVGKVDAAGYRATRALIGARGLRLVQQRGIGGGSTSGIVEHWVATPIVGGKDEKGAHFLFTADDKAYWSPLAAVKKGVEAAALPGNDLFDARHLLRRDGRVVLIVEGGGAGQARGALRLGEGQAGKKISWRPLADLKLGSPGRCALVDGPGGKLHLVACVRSLELRAAKDDQFAVWDITGPGVKAPALTPWISPGSSGGTDARAVATGEGEAILAWGTMNRIYLRPVALEQGGR